MCDWFITKPPEAVVLFMFTWVQVMRELWLKSVCFLLGRVALCVCFMFTDKLKQWNFWNAVTEWWGAGMDICLERGADLHMAQLMPLPLTVSCFSKIQINVPVRKRTGLPKLEEIIKEYSETSYKLNLSSTSRKLERHKKTDRTLFRRTRRTSDSQWFEADERPLLKQQLTCVRHEMNSGLTSGCRR